MRAISIWQPWASLVAFGAKQYETRSWSTPYRGPIAIHAAKTQDLPSLGLCTRSPFREALVAGGVKVIRDLPFGMIVATATLSDCLRTSEIVDSLSDQERSFGDFRPGRWAWRISDVTKLTTPIPYRGRQGLFTIPDDFNIIRKPTPDHGKTSNGNTAEKH